MSRKRKILYGLGITLLLSGTGFYALVVRPFLEVRTVAVAGSVHMLQGNDGNVGLSAGADGVFMVDCMYGLMSGNILTALAALTDQPLRYVVNTHVHGDHTDGNENMAEGGAAIVAHDNLRARLSAEQYIKAWDARIPPAPAAALPTVTYADNKTFLMNGEEILVFHPPPAHTDGDSVVISARPTWFRWATSSSMACTRSSIFPAGVPWMA